MACKCAAEMNEKLATMNTKLASAFSFRRKGELRMELIPVLIQTEKITPRGKKPPLVVPTFCPFCGTSYADLTALDTCGPI